MSYINYLDGNELCSIPETGSSSRGFKVNDIEGVILFDSDFSETQVVLEYIFSPTAGEDIMVPIQVQEALIAWIAWKDIESLPSSRKVTDAEKSRRQKSYFREKRNGKFRSKPFRLSESNPIKKLMLSSSASAQGNTQGSTIITAAAAPTGLSEFVELFSSRAALATDADKYVFLNATSVAVDYTIDPVTMRGKTFHIKCTNADHRVRILPASGTIDSGTEVELGLNGVRWVYASDGVNLQIVL